MFFCALSSYLSFSYCQIQQETVWINHAQTRSGSHKAKQFKVFQKDTGVKEMVLQSPLCYCWFADISKCVPKLYLKLSF